MRVLKALRQVTAITGPQLDQAIAALEATEPCARCGGSGVEPGADRGLPPWECSRCEGTGEQRVIR